MLYLGKILSGTSDTAQSRNVVVRQRGKMINCVSKVVGSIVTGGIWM